jgi:hypothetical protein
MNSDFEVKGPVCTLKQRSTSRFGLDEQPNRENFDAKFSPAGQILKQTDYTNAAAVYRTTCWVYDDAGLLIRALEFDSAGTETAISKFTHAEGRRECITRDAKGIVTRRIEDEFAGDLLTRIANYGSDGKLTRLKIFEYADGKLLRSVSQYYAPGGKLHEHWFTNYDSEGRMAKTFGLKSDGAPLGDGKYSHEYDAKGRRARVWSFNDGEDVANAVTTSEYVDDEYGNWIERVDIAQSMRDSAARRRVTTRQLTYFPAETPRS